MSKLENQLESQQKKHLEPAALLVIDVQKSFLARDYWTERDVPAFRDNLLGLIETAKAGNVPVVRILHADSDGPFAPESGLVVPMDFVPAHHDVQFIKQAHNSFTTTGLQLWLQQRGIRRVLISGIRSEQCCETTARVASDLGFQVDYITDATLTFDMRDPRDGQIVSAEAIKSRTELVLRDRFARIVSTRECLAEIRAG